MFPFPGATQLGPAQAGRQHGPVPAPPLLRARVHAADGRRKPAVPGHHRAGARPADVRRQELDGGVRPASRSLPHGGCHLPRPSVDQGGRRTDAEHTTPQQRLLRAVDSQQRPGNHSSLTHFTICYEMKYVIISVYSAHSGLH